jgi:hypothetical protein
MQISRQILAALLLQNAHDELTVSRPCDTSSTRDGIRFRGTKPCPLRNYLGVGFE